MTASERTRDPLGEPIQDRVFWEIVYRAVLSIASAIKRRHLI